MEADMAGERVDLVNEYKVTTGQPLSGSMPLSHKIVIDPQNGRKKIIRDPDTEDIVYDLIEHYMTHQSKKKTIVYAKTVHHVAISHDSLTRLLSNTMLMGAYRENSNYCEAYLSPEDFGKLQGILHRNVKDNTAENRAYIFSGLIKCPECGCLLKGYIHVNYSRDKSKMWRYKRYRCGKYSKDGQCTYNKSIGESTFEKLMLADIEEHLNKAKVKAAEVKEEKAVKIHEYDIEEIYERIDRLNYSWNTGKIRTVEKYEADYAELMELLEKAQAERGKVEVKDFSKIETILHSGWEAIYNNLDDAYKRAFWRSFIEYIEIEWTTETKRIKHIEFY